MKISPIGVEAFCSISAIGAEYLAIKEALINEQNYMVKRNDLLVGKKSTWVAEVNYPFPPINYLNDAFQSKNTQLALLSLNQIKAEIEDIKHRFHKNRIGVVIGTSTSGIADNEAFIKQGIATGKMGAGWSYARQEIGTIAEVIKNELQLSGPCYAISTACSSGAKTFVSAMRLLESDFCDAVIVGGVDTLCQLPLNGFNSLDSLSATICKPFAANRDGINIGEAAAFFILTKKESEIQLLSFGESSDAYHVSSPDPEGLGAIRAMQQALRLANLTADEIDYLNLHGTATIKNDAMEAKAVTAVFADHPLWISSTKHKTGHCLGAAGALEAYFCCAVLVQTETSWLPLHQSDNIAKEFTALHFVTKSSKLPQKIKTVMSNSFAFGGSNCSLIFGSR